MHTCTDTKLKNELGFYNKWIKLIHNSGGLFDIPGKLYPQSTFFITV